MNPNSSSNKQQYMSNDGDLHSSKMAAKFDDMTPSSNDPNKHDTTRGKTGAGYGGAPTGSGFADNDPTLRNANTGSGLTGHSNTGGLTGHSSSGLGGHSTNTGTGLGSTGAGYGSSNNQQYMSNDGDVHNSRMAAKFDDATPSRGQHSNTGLTGSGHPSGMGGTGLGSGTTGSGQYMAQDGDRHRTQAGTAFDNATPSHNNNNTTGLSSGDSYGRGTTLGSGTGGNYVANDGDRHHTSTGAKVDSSTNRDHSSTTGTHGHNTTHDNNNKPSMMDKLKGKGEELVGKMQKDPVKQQHGEELQGKTNTY